MQAIALPPKGYKATGSGDIIGWGTTNKEETKASDVLLKASLPVSDPEGNYCFSFLIFTYFI